MSTPGKQCFCYQCNRTVLLGAGSVELSCPGCRGDFLEEVTFPAPTILPFPFALSSSSSSIASSNLSNFLHLEDAPRVSSRSRSGAASVAPENQPEPSDLRVFFQNYLRGIREGGVNMEDLLDDDAVANLVAGVGGASLRDYFVGPGMERLIEQLAENDPNRYGTPPAAKSAMSTLPDLVVTDAMVAAAEGAEGSVCKQDFSPGDGAKQMPCRHIYHAGCIVPWLELHNSCPICRFELPTDDPDYEAKKASNPHPSAASGSSTAAEKGGEETARVMER